MPQTASPATKTTLVPGRNGDPVPADSFFHVLYHLMIRPRSAISSDLIPGSLGIHHCRNNGFNSGLLVNHSYPNALTRGFQQYYYSFLYKG